MNSRYGRSIRSLIFCATVLETLYILLFWPRPTSMDGLPPYFMFTSACIFGILRWCTDREEDATTTGRMFFLISLCTAVSWWRFPSTPFGNWLAGLRIIVCFMGMSFIQKHKNYLRATSPAENNTQ